MKVQKNRVVAFRIPEKSGIDLDTTAVSSGIVGVRSGNQLARKLTLDYLNGKLIYLRKQDKTEDPALT